MGVLKLVSGDITADNLLSECDAIVNPTNPMMRMGMGVSGAIFRKAGVDELEAYTEKTYGISYEDISRKNEMKPTEIRITPGFRLPCKIIFAQSPNLNCYSADRYSELYELLLQTYKNVLIESVSRHFDTVLMPSLGTGHYGFEHERVAKDVIRLLQDFTESHPLNVIFALFEDETKELYERYLNKR